VIDRIVVWALRLKSERGQDAMEYALLGGLIAVAILVTVALFGTALSDWFNGMATEIDGWAP